uniref:Uncharacterized protein n=2 Tax=Octopus bimaculoides TaxID=37653 RepID=A0A0L8G324_OCTBM
MPEEKLEATDKPRLPFQNASSFVSSRRKMFEKSSLTEDDDKARKMMKQTPKQTDNKKVLKDEIGTTIKPKFPSGISSPNWSSVKKANEQIGENIKATTPVKTSDTPDYTYFIDRSELKIQIQEKQRIVFSRKKPSDSVSRNLLERSIKDSSGERNSKCTPAKSSSEQVKNVKKKKNSQIETVTVAGKSRFSFRGEVPLHHSSKDTPENQVADVKDAKYKQISESQETENNGSRQVSDKDHTIQHKPQTDFYKTNIQDFHSDSGIQYPNSQKEPTFLATKPKSVHSVNNSKSPIQDKKEIISSVKESQLDSFSHKDEISLSLPSPSNNTNQVSRIRSEQKDVSDPEKYNNDKLRLLPAASDSRKVPIHPELISTKSSLLSSTNDWIDHTETKLPLSSRETIKRSKPKTSNNSGDILSIGHVVPSDVSSHLASKPVTDKPTVSSSLSKPITAAQTSQQTSLYWIDRKETFFSAERTKATRSKHKSEKDDSNEKKSTSNDYKSFPEKYAENRPGRVDQSPPRHSQSDNKVKKFSSSNHSEVKKFGTCEAMQKSGLITTPVKEITCKAPLKINVDYKSETTVDCPKDVVSKPHCESDKSTANISNVHVDKQIDKKNIPTYENVGVFSSEPDMKLNLENETSGTISADKHVANLASQKTKDGPDENISSDKLVTNKTPPKSKETTFGPDIKIPDNKYVAEVTSPKTKETTFGPDTKVSADRHVANLASPKTKETMFGPDEDISENRHVAKETTFGPDEKVLTDKYVENLASPKRKETFSSEENMSADKHVANLVSPKSKETTFGSEENMSADKHVVNLVSPKSKETTFGSEENMSADKHVANLVSPKSKETTFGSQENISVGKHVVNLASPKSKETTFGSEGNISADKHVANLVSPKSKETTFGSEENITAVKLDANLNSPETKVTTFGPDKSITKNRYVAKETTFDPDKKTQNDKHVVHVVSPKTKETTFGSEENISAVKQLAKLTLPKTKESTFGPKVTSSKTKETTFGSEEKVPADKHVTKLNAPKRNETEFGSEENISEDKHVAKGTTISLHTKKSPEQHVASLATPERKTAFGSKENISAVKQLAKMTIYKAKESTFSPDKNISADKHVANLVSPKSKETTFGSEENMSDDKHVANLAFPKSNETTFGSEENIRADKHVAKLASLKRNETTFGSEENISADKHVVNLASPNRRETTFGSDENVSADKHVANLASPRSKETTFGSEENISADKHVANLASPKRRETTFGSEENISADKHVANLASPKSKETTFGSEENISVDKHVANLVSPKSKETAFGSEEITSAGKHVANLASPKSKETTFGSEENISADKHVANLASPKRRETTFGSEENISADKHMVNLASPKRRETTFGSEENISAGKHVASLASPKSKETTFGSEGNISADKHVANLVSPKSKEAVSSEVSVSADNKILPKKMGKELDKLSSSSLDVHSTMTSNKLELSIDDKKENSDTTLVLSKPEDEAVHWIDRKENTFSPNCKASLKKKRPVISQSFEEKLSSGFGLQHKPLSTTSVSFGNKVSQSKNESEAVNLNSVSEDTLSSSKIIPRFSSWIGFKKNDSTPESVGSASIKHNQKQYSMPMKEDKNLDVKDLAQTKNTIKQFNDVVGVNKNLPPAPSMTTDVSEPLLDYWVERKESFLSDSKTNSGHWIYTYTRPQLFAKNDNNIKTSGRSEKSNEFVKYESSYGNKLETHNTADFPIKENNLQQKSIEDTYLNKKAGYGLDSVNSNEDIYPLEEDGIKLKVELEFNQDVTRTDTLEPDDQSFTFVKEYTSIEPNSSQSEKFGKPSKSDSNNKNLSKTSESGVYFVEMNSDDDKESNISGYPVEYNNGIISYSSYPKHQNLSSEPYAESDPSKQSSSDHYDPQKPAIKLRQSQKNYSPHFTESVNETEIDSHFENNSETDTLSKWNDTDSPVKAKSITSDFSPRERNYQDTPSFLESCSSQSHPVREMSAIANLRDMVLNDEKIAYQQFLNNNTSRNYKHLKQSPENQYSAKALNYPLYEDDNIFKPTELSDAFEYTSSASEMLPNPATPNRNKAKYNTQPSH